LRVSAVSRQRFTKNVRAASGLERVVDIDVASEVTDENRPG